MKQLISRSLQLLTFQIPSTFRRCTNFLSHLRHRAVERDDDRNAAREKDCRDYAVLWTTAYEAYAKEERDREKRLGPSGMLQYLQQQSEEAKINWERFQVRIYIRFPLVLCSFCPGWLWWNRRVQAHQCAIG